MSRKYLLVLVIAIAIFVGPQMTMASDEATGSTETKYKISVGDTLTPFMLKEYGGKGSYFALRGYCGEPRKNSYNKPRKTVVLSFFATWCQPCKKEIPELEEAAKSWGDDVEVFLISVGDKKALLDKWITEYPTELKILQDPYKSTSVERYEIKSLPTILLLDEQSVVKYIKRGYSEETMSEINLLITSFNEETNDSATISTEQSRSISNSISRFCPAIDPIVKALQSS